MRGLCVCVCVCVYIYMFDKLPFLGEKGLCYVFALISCDCFIFLFQYLASSPLSLLVNFKFSCVHSHPLIYPCGSGLTKVQVRVCRCVVYVYVIGASVGVRQTY